MKGRRIMPDDEGHLQLHEFQPGDYGRATAEELQGRVASSWMCCTPNGMLGNLSKHEVTEHEDGTITVSPSILVTGEKSWHGYLERGVWREV